MQYDHSICEIPPFALSMYYCQAQIIATKKITGSQTADPGLLAERNILKDEVQDLFWNRAERGVSYMSERRRYPEINEADRNFVAFTIGGGPL